MSYTSPLLRLSGLVLCALVSVATPVHATDAIPHNAIDAVICRVNGAEIRGRELQAELSRRMPGASFHGSVDAARRLELERASLKTLIDVELKFQDAEQRGIAVSDDELQHALRGVIARYPNEKAFEARLTASGFTRDDVRAALRRRQLTSKVEERLLDAAPAVDDESMRRYYDENRAVLVMPAQANVRRIFIRVPPLGRNPEVWQGTIDRLADARARIIAGESFESLVAEISEASKDEKDKGGLLGLVHPNQLEEELDAAIWSLSEAGLSQPIRTFRGVHLLKVENLIPSHPMEFREIKEKLRGNLKRTRDRELLETWLADLRAKANIEILVPTLAD
ncbi:MAG: hypothetical protein GY725_12650 [bacterium]|nr:hypothetical protein [bacterium]